MPRAPRVKRATLASTIEAKIRTDIVHGRFPPGYRLQAGELAERYDVSPTPLREALQRLAAQQLVEIDPRLGARVAPISLAHLRDTYRVRGVLEAIAVREAVECGDEGWEALLRESFRGFESAVAHSEQQRDVTAWSLAHEHFHQSLISACTSQWLHTLLATIHVHSERYRTLAALTGERDPIREHRAIFAAAAARDAEGAVQALMAHLNETVRLIEKTTLLPKDEGPDAGTDDPPPVLSAHRSFSGEVG